MSDLEIILQEAELTKILKLNNLSLTSPEMDRIFHYLDSKENTLTEISIENLKIKEPDFYDLFLFISETQKPLKKIRLKNSQFKKYRKLMTNFKKCCSKLENLTEIDISENKLNSLQYGQIMSIIKTRETQLTLNMTGNKFTNDDEKNFRKFIESQNNLTEIILERTNFTKDMINNLSQIITRNSTIRFSSHLINPSQIMDRSQINKREKRKIIYVDFSTEIQKHIKPKQLIHCECSRYMSVSEMFNCTNCCKSVCKYCTANKVSCYICYSCSKSHVPAMVYNVNSNAKNMCASCLECPICLNILGIKHGDKKEVDPYFFYCKFCFWNSKNYAIASGSSDELVSGNFDVTSLIIKALENLLVSAFEIQKLIIKNNNQKSLIRIMEQNFFNNNSRNQNKDWGDIVKKDKIQEDNIFAFDYKFSFIKEALLISPFLPEKNPKIEDIKNPIYFKILKQSKDLTKKQYIDKFKANEFNMMLFKEFPLRTYRSKKEYLIPKKQLHLYITKSCNTCKKSLVNYVRQTDTVEMSNTSFYYETNLTYKIQKLFKMNSEEDSLDEKYRLKLNLINFTSYKLIIDLKCLENCKFSNGSQNFNKTFEFNKDSFNITSLSANMNTLSQNLSDDIFIDFVVNAEDEKVFFILEQTNTICTQNQSVIKNKVFIDFGTKEEFKYFLEMSNPISK